MNTQLLHLQNPSFLTETVPKETRLTFFKCVRWQVEETLDPINCPYHYFCDSNYPGNYPSYVDVLVLLFTTASYLATLVVMVSTRGRTNLSQSKRYLLPSGPILLPIILLILAKGYRVNSEFSLSCVAPAILQLVQVSALTFDNGIDKDLRYAFFETSTISGILHASLYLDSIILPYYTGFDALFSSAFSGVCPSCVCRRDVLIVGGRLVKYRGWSITTFLVVGALCFRIICRMTDEHRSKFMLIKSWLESLGWISVTVDCVYLIRKIPPEQTILQVATFGGILLLICLHLVKKVTTQISKFSSRSSLIKISSVEG